MDKPKTYNMLLQTLVQTIDQNNNKIQRNTLVEKKLFHERAKI